MCHRIRLVVCAGALDFYTPLVTANCMLMDSVKDVNYVRVFKTLVKLKPRQYF